MTTIRCYSELKNLDSFSDRFRYLQLNTQIGVATFGFDRWLNQRFYTSAEWRHVRNLVIARDEGCDLGVEGYEIYHRVHIHHMNPMSVADVVDREDSILDPEFLIAVSPTTHNAIHFGDESLLRRPHVPRRPGDTKLW